MLATCKCGYGLEYKHHICCSEDNASELQEDLEAEEGRYRDAKTIFSRNNHHHSKMVTGKLCTKKVLNNFKKEVKHIKQTSEPTIVPLSKPDADVETVSLKQL